MSYAFILGFSSLGHADVTYDGHLSLDANGNQTEYDVFFDITYSYDGREIEGGKLGLGSDGTNQYMYIQHPLGFKDLSYGNDNNEKYRVGWNGQNDGNPSLHGAVHSEYFEVSFDGGSNVKFNLGLTEAANSTTNVAGVSGFKSTLDYNRSQVAMLQPGTTDLGVFEAHSPETTDCGNETSSDPSCYIVKDTLENRLNNAGGPIIDWDFNFGIEIQLSNAFFSNLQGITANNFGYKDSSKLINLVGLHASDPKTIATTKHGHVPCQNPISGLDQNHEACNATVTPHVDVPEPSSILMFSLGMAGLWLKRKKIIKI